ncbi:MAG TPA: gas vesicle protein GvpJ [Terriglobales bacterium]|nr:gas vesicle protein GvpJ [Terriglobales bacterium]
MAVVRDEGRATLIDVLDRVLDKGIVIDAWVRVSLGGLDLLMVEARVVIASFETYLSYGDNLVFSGLVAAPPLGVAS